jgi:hypothetical protein
LFHYSENNRKWHAFLQCVDFVGILKSHFLKNKIFKYFLHLWFFPGEIYQVIKGKLPNQLKSFCFCHNQLVFQGFSSVWDSLVSNSNLNPTNKLKYLDLVLLEAAMLAFLRYFSRIHETGLKSKKELWTGWIWHAVYTAWSNSTNS